MKDNQYFIPSFFVANILRTTIHYVFSGEMKNKILERSGKKEQIIIVTIIMCRFISFISHTEFFCHSCNVKNKIKKLKNVPNS